VGSINKMSCGCNKCEKCAKVKVLTNFKEGGLKRWFKEDWKTSDGRPCGNKTKKEEACRPTKRITEDTPKTWSQVDKNKINRKKQEANKKGKQFADYGN